MIKVKDIIQEIRDSMGDDTNSLPVNTILSFINEGLRELTSELIYFSPFVMDDTIELSDYTQSGKAAQEWRLDDDSVGEIAHIRSLVLTDAENCHRCEVGVAKTPNRIFNRISQKDCSVCKSPCCIEDINATIVKKLTGTYLRTDQPLPSGTLAHIQYEFVPAIIRKCDIEKTVPVNLTFYNPLLLLVKAKVHSYNADDSRALALYENYDKMIFELKQQLARDNSDFVLRRSF